MDKNYTNLNVDENLQNTINNFQESKEDNKINMVLIIVSVFLLLVTGILGFIFLKSKAKIENTSVLQDKKIGGIQENKDGDVSIEKRENLFPESERNKEVTPTSSKNASLEAIEKEIQKIDLEGIDSGDSSIESDLQNL